jgi:CysZ protein
VIRAMTLALGDLGDRSILAILLQALAITAALFVALGAVAGYFLSGSDPCALVGSSCVLDSGSGGVGGVLLALIAGWLLFPGVAIGVISGFADRIAARVEARHYPPAAADARRIGIGRSAWMGVKSSGRILLYNLTALPFYIVLLVTGAGPFILFVIVNGMAFGRDLGELASARHGTRAQGQAWQHAHRGEMRLLGIVVSGLFLIPFANLIAPIVGVAAAVHLFRRPRTA